MSLQLQLQLQTNMLINMSLSHYFNRFLQNWTFTLHVLATAASLLLPYISLHFKFSDQGFSIFLECFSHISFKFCLHQKLRFLHDVQSAELYNVSTRLSLLSSTYSKAQKQITAAFFWQHIISLNCNIKPTVLPTQTSILNLRGVLYKIF